MECIWEVWFERINKDIGEVSPELKYTRYNNTSCTSFIKATRNNEAEQDGANEEELIENKRDEGQKASKSGSQTRNVEERNRRIIFDQKDEVPGQQAVRTNWPPLKETTARWTKTKPCEEAESRSE